MLILRRSQVGEPVVVVVDDADSIPQFESFTAADAKAGGEGSGAPAEKPEKSGGGGGEEPSTRGVLPKAGTDDNAAGRDPSLDGEAPGSSLSKGTASPAGVEAPPTAGHDSRAPSTPYARRLAREAGVDIAGVKGSGPGGRIVAGDVHRYQKAGGAQGAAGGTVATGGAAGDPGSAFTDEKASQIRRVVAKRLLESKTTVPHYYLSIDCAVSKLSAMRAALNSRLAAGAAKDTPPAKVSVNDFVIKAAAAALRAVPAVNASWHGEFIRQYRNVDVTVAVQTEAGLMVPVVRDADLKGLAAISAEVRALAGKVRPANRGAYARCRRARRHCLCTSKSQGAQRM